MISFAIITDGCEPEKLEREIESIHALNINAYEIIVSGNPPIGIEADIIVPMPHTAKQGRLGALRNGAVSVARGNVLVVADDDMIFWKDWFIGYWGDEKEWDVLACRILNPDGTRYWDWKANENGLNWLLDYDEVHPLVSLTGGLTIMKSHVWQAVKWDDDLGFNQAEDVDFTNKVKAAGFTIKFNKHMTVTHDSNYTQRGKGVYKV